MAFCQHKAYFLVEGSSLPEHMWGYPQPSCFSTGHFLPLTTDDDTPHALIKSSHYLQRNNIILLFVQQLIWYLSQIRAKDPLILQYL